MYFRNDMFVAQTQSPYSRLMKEAKVEFTLRHDPLAGMSRSMYARIRAWINAGYCSCPNGEAGARWRMLMLANQADYLFEQPSNRFFYIMFVERLGIDVNRQEQAEKINALVALYGASKEWKNSPPLSINDLYEERQIDNWGRINTKLAISGYYFGLITRSELHLLRSVVRALGHPLGDKARIAQAVESIANPLEFKVCACEVTQRNGTKRYHIYKLTQLKGGADGNDSYVSPA